VAKISGVTVALGVAGSAMLYTGLRNITMADYIRSLVKLQPVPVGPSDLPASGASGLVGGISLNDNKVPPGTPLAAAVVASALSYTSPDGKKVPYVWAGETPAGWDCSGFVTWVLHHDHGLDPPDNEHTVTAQFMTWSGALTVSDVAPGDLVCWASHVGICVGPNLMANAVGVGIGTKVTGWSNLTPPVFRRPKAYADAAQQPVKPQGD